jgi:hypothetical protein
MIKQSINDQQLIRFEKVLFDFTGKCLHLVHQMGPVIKTFI